MTTYGEGFPLTCGRYGWVLGHSLGPSDPLRPASVARARQKTSPACARRVVTPRFRPLSTSDAFPRLESRRAVVYRCSTTTGPRFTASRRRALRRTSPFARVALLVRDVF